MNFTSQICTTKEQSERLLALGLKKETADMMYCKTSYGTFVTAKDDDYLEHLDYPAWSLHRLIEMIPDKIAYPTIYDSAPVRISKIRYTTYTAFLISMAMKIFQLLAIMRL